MKTLGYHFTKHPSSKFCVIQLQGSFESNNAMHFLNQLTQHVDKLGIQCTLDMNQVEEVDMIGLNALAIAKRAFEKAGKKLLFILDESQAQLLIERRHTFQTPATFNTQFHYN